MKPLRRAGCLNCSAACNSGLASGVSIEQEPAVKHRANAKKVTCPECGSTNVVRICYGLPGPELFERAKRGEIVLGGCCITGNDPTCHCKDCGHNWSRDWARDGGQ